MGRRKKEEKQFEPINDDIDAPVDQGQEEITQEEQQPEPVEKKDDVLDLSQPAGDLPPTLEQVKQAEALASEMDAFFRVDEHWRHCEDALQRHRESLQFSFMDADAKQADLWANHLRWLHYGDALNIMRDAHQKEASQLRDQWEKSKKGIAETPLIDAAEEAAKTITPEPQTEIIKTGSLVNTETGEVFGTDGNSRKYTQLVEEQLSKCTKLMVTQALGNLGSDEQYCIPDSFGKPVFLAPEGNEWIAVRADYVDPQESVCGYGYTPFDARDSLMSAEMDAINNQERLERADVEDESGGLEGDEDEGELEPDLAEVAE